MFAELILSTESMVVVTGLVVALAGAIGFLFNMLIASKDAQLKSSDDRLKAMESRAKSYEEMSEEAISHLESLLAERLRDKKATKTGSKKVDALASVVPEHNSPVTIAQQATADLQTMRARLVAVALDLNLPPRETARPANGKEEAESKKT